MSHASLTILQLTHQGDGAGSTQSILNLSEHLQRRGHRVLLGCRAESLLARLGRDAGLGAVALDFSRLAPLARRLAEVMARERVDVVNSHASRDRRALTWLRWRRCLPQALVVTRRTMPLTSPLELFAIGHAADRTVAVSEAVARALRRRWHPGGRLRVVPNGIDVVRVDAPVPAPELAAARAARAAGGPGVRRRRAGRGARRPRGGAAAAPPGRIPAVHRAAARLLPPGRAGRAAVPHRRPVPGAARGDGPGAAGRGIRRGGQSRPRRSRYRRARTAARSPGVGSGAGAADRGSGRPRPAGRGGARPGPSRLHAGAYRRANRRGLPGGAAAPAIAPWGTPPLALGAHADAAHGHHPDPQRVDADCRVCPASLLER